MAALTTFLAGVAMMPCHVLAYTKLGTFLMLVMCFAWLYSTLFFQSLCWVVGPIGQCFNIRQRYLDGCFSRSSRPISVQSGDVATRSQSTDRHSSGISNRGNPRSDNNDGDDDSLLMEFGSL